MGSSFDQYMGDALTLGGRTARKQEKAQRQAANQAREDNALATATATRQQQEAEAAMARARKTPDMTTLLGAEQNASLLGEETLLTRTKRKQPLGGLSELGA